MDFIKITDILLWLAVCEHACTCAYGWWGDGGGVGVGVCWGEETEHCTALYSCMTVNYHLWRGDSEAGTLADSAHLQAAALGTCIKDELIT